MASDEFSPHLIAAADNLPNQPGVYLFLDEDHTVLYVGKAKNLKKRVKSYFHSRQHSTKVQKLLLHIKFIEHISLNSESEALLLECDLIKKHRPKYNVLLRDDKSYPMIVLDKTHPFPKLYPYRGERDHSGDKRYFGPYASPSTVRKTLDVLHQLFGLRQCSDHDFKTRQRPCLQYQIKRCAAPCVGYIDEARYRASVEIVEKFLRGKHSEIIDDFVVQMNQASHVKDYELAAEYRDKIKLLQKLVLSGPKVYDDIAKDMITFVRSGKLLCAYVFSFREGACRGARYYLLSHDSLDESTDYAEAFVSQFYLEENHPFDEWPLEIILSSSLSNRKLVEAVLKEKFGHPIKIIQEIPALMQPWFELSIENARKCIERLTETTRDYQLGLVDLARLIEIESVDRIECFDISHTQGTETVASCVVFDENGPNRAAFRRYNIDAVTPGDDYAAILDVVRRRYTSLLKRTMELPSLILIDGGKGQLNQAIKALEEVGILLDSVRIMAISKGLDRKAGWEKYYLYTDAGIKELRPNDAVTLLLQAVRDEAHNFAISNHRNRRSKRALQSVLEEIPGIGQSKRRALLQYFGGLEEIKQASFVELAKVPGIGEKLAKIIANYLRDK